MDTVAARMARQWAGIERAMKREPQSGRLVDTYFALIDEMTAELERRRMIDEESVMDDDEIIEFLLWALATAAPDAKATRH
jgi:hypothetical protein